MSTNLEYRAGERQRKRESWQQASKVQWEKRQQRSSVRDKKQRRHFFVGRTTWKYCSDGDKMGNGQFQKISIPNNGRLPCFNPPPPCLRKFQNASEFHNREPPLPFRISWFFWKYIFDLATPIWTNKHEFMPPQGCDLAAPGDKLYSSATRKTYRYWPGCANSFLSPNLAIKINITYVNFTPLCFLVLFWRLQSKIAQIQTVKIFWRSNIPLSLVASFYTSCSVHTYVPVHTYINSIYPRILV